MTTLQIISLTALQLALLYFTYRCGYSWGHWNGLHEGYMHGKREVMIEGDEVAFDPKGNVVFHESKLN